MTPDRCKLSIRIARGDDVDPEHVNRVLNAIPDIGHRRGDRRFSPDGKRELTPWSRGNWSIRSPEEDSAPLENHLDWAEEFARERRVGFEQLLIEQHDIELFIGVFAPPGNFGYELEFGRYPVICNLGFRLGFDIYAL